MSRNKGKVVSIIGNMISVKTEADIIQNEVAYVLMQEKRLKSEVIKIEGDIAFLQVYEYTTGITIGDEVEFSGELLSVELGPGLLGQIYDGLQNPLPKVAEKAGFFLPIGMELGALSQKKEWEFEPLVKTGDSVRRGDVLGSVPEGIFKHKIMVPYDLHGDYEITEIATKGKYKIIDKIAFLTGQDGESKEIKMSFDWPVKVPIDAYRERLLPEQPLNTKVRIIDTLFPVARGGTYCIPGPFGAGKTVLQQLISRYADVDIVIIAACGERAGEVVETLREFPKLQDPRTGRTLMERTIIICNTSSMPVAAREASVYTATTIGEYYRQMGLNVLLLADSTSRWAQAMREISGRLEEIPGEEAYPAYLESRIASFYERASLVKLNNGETGSLTIGGTVSPAGGNFEEPVTQGTLKVVGAFLGLSSDRANARKYPSIDPLESWSKYNSLVDDELIMQARGVMVEGDQVDQMMKVVGEEGTSLDDFIIYLKAEFLDAVYLQQNGFNKIDASTGPERQKYVFSKVGGVLKAGLQFKDKAHARDYFYKLRNMFIDWNYTEWNSDEFKGTEDDIDKLLKENVNEKSMH